MSLVEVEFNWQRVFTPEEQEELKALSLNPISFQPDGTISWETKQVILCIEDAARFGKFEVLRVINNPTVARLHSYGQRETTIVNERCSVAVAGLGLLTVDTVEVVTNYCTDKLQKKLNDGWRILAICVQPDQRRPDYILGKSDKVGTVPCV